MGRSKTIIIGFLPRTGKKKKAQNKVVYETLLLTLRKLLT